jgi:hypothetical protein
MAGCVSGHQRSVLIEREDVIARAASAGIAVLRKA